MDLSTSKNIFTHLLYQKCPDALPNFFAIFLEDPAHMESHPSHMDLDFKMILGLKQNKKIQMEFTAESHAQKLKHLLGKFDAYLQS